MGILTVYDPAHGLRVKVNFIHIISGCANHIVIELYSAPATLPGGRYPDHMMNKILPAEPARSYITPREVADHLYPFTQLLQNSPPASFPEGKIVYTCLHVKENPHSNRFSSSRSAAALPAIKHLSRPRCLHFAMKIRVDTSNFHGSQARLKNPELFPGSLSGLVILDEVQLVDLTGFNIEEAGSSNSEKLWFRGGFPRSYPGADDNDAVVWLEAFVRTFIERDLPQPGHLTGTKIMNKLLMMIASVQGQILNCSSPGRSMGLSYKTLQGYIAMLPLKPAGG